jgi:hypothetical protein
LSVRLNISVQHEKPYPAMGKPCCEPAPAARMRWVAASCVALIGLAACAKAEDTPGPDTGVDPGVDPDADTALDPAADGEDIPADAEPDGDLPADLPLDPMMDEAPTDTEPDPPVDSDGLDPAEDEPVDMPDDIPEDTPADDGGSGTVFASWSFASCPEGWSAASLGHEELPSVSWECGRPSSGPGSDHGGGTGNLFATRLAGTYSWFEWSALTSPALDLSAATGSVTLTFWHWYEFEWCVSTCGAYNPDPSALDGGNVEVWNGSAWVPITPVGGYPGTLRFFDSYYTHPMQGDPGYNAEGTERTWLQASFDLTPHLNAALRVRFLFGSDSGVSEDGWYIDDIVIASP